MERKCHPTRRRIDVKKTIFSSAAGHTFQSSTRTSSNFTPTFSSDAARDVALTSSRSKSHAFASFRLWRTYTKWSFSTEELEQLRDNVGKVRATKRYVSFHNITMYEDGARMKSIKDQGKDLLPQGGERGVDSLKRTLIAARIEFPVSKGELFDELYWRTVDIDDGRRVHPKVFLERLSDGAKFESLDQVLESIETESLEHEAQTSR